MKKIFLVLIATIFFFSVQAQSFRGGVMAGLATSQVDGDNYAGFNRAGINIGAFVNHGLGNNFLWQMEMKYIQKGSYKNENPDVGDYNIYSLKLHYIEVPFLIRYLYKNKFSFEAGLSGGYLAKYKEADQIGELPYDPSRPDFHKFELSSHLGAYYYINENLWVSVRSSYSVIPIREHAGGGVHWTNRGQYNNVLQFTLYYTFGKKNE